MKYVDPHEDFSTIVECSSWEDLYTAHDDFCKDGVWMFRGQKNAGWGLETTLDRLAFITKSSDIRKLELGLLRKFKREYPLHANRIPQEDDLIEWVSLMQHYGAPTRLLDCTYSLYVATFFALENIEWIEESAVWAINTSWLENKLFLKYPKYKKVLIEDRNWRKEENVRRLINKSVVVKINPYYVHERLSIQQGGFLFTGDVTKTFFNNLLEFAGSKKELKKYLFKFVMTGDISKRKRALEDLYRMNITRTTLFPGMDGYASSLWVTAYILPDTLAPGEEYPIYYGF